MRGLLTSLTSSQRLLLSFFDFLPLLLSAGILKEAVPYLAPSPPPPQKKKGKNKLTKETLSLTHTLVCLYLSLRLPFSLSYLSFLSLFLPLCIPWSRFQISLTLTPPPTQGSAGGKLITCYTCIIYTKGPTATYNLLEYLTLGPSDSTWQVLRSDSLPPVGTCYSYIYL